MFQIERNVSVPPVSRPPRCKYPFRDMAVGDSFVVSAEEAKWSPLRRANGGHRSAVHIAASAAGKRLGCKFTCRRQPDRSVRVWRVA